MAILSLVRGLRRAAPATDDGERIYVVGDLHGCRDLFVALLAKVEAHVQALPPARSIHLVLLGDLVDRGPDTAGLLRLVCDLSKQSNRLIVLRGNHEEAMLRAIDGATGAARDWLRIGGERTLRSYGIEPPRDADGEGAAMRALAQAMPSDIVGWLRGLPLTARSGDYLFVHAGIRPGVPINRQNRQDLMWIREGFLDSQVDHGAIVVHGHTIVPDIEFRPNRIAIDIGTYRTGVAKALYLDGDKREIIAAELPGGAC